MNTERMTALSSAAANHRSVVVPLKREERPLPCVGLGTLCAAVQRMTVQELGDLVASRGLMPSELLAGRELLRAA